MNVERAAILAGGNGTRLLPLTKYTNKHLLPIYDKFMVFYAIEALKSLGTKNICVVTGMKHVTEFQRILSDGREFGVQIEYRTQEKALGLADALGMTEGYFGSNKVVVILGDALFKKVSIPKVALEDKNAYVVATDYTDKIGINPKSVGIAEIDSTGKVLHITEKPQHPKSTMMIAGFYIFPNDCYDYIKKMKPSGRGEYEITDIHNWYADQGRLRTLNDVEFVGDAGGLDSLLDMSIWRRNIIKGGD